MMFKERQGCDISCSHVHRWRTAQHIYCATVPKHNFKEFASFFAYFLFWIHVLFIFYVRNRSPELQE